MKYYREQALTVISELVVNGGGSLTDNDLTVFGKTPDEATEHEERIAEIYEVIFRGFFHCAAKGIALIPESRVTERFRRPIRDNYPEASESFLNFAVTYWTLKVLVIDLLQKDMEWIGAHLLGELERDIGSVFFPMPGKVKIPPSKREDFQIQLIEKSGANIDILEFIDGNPILIRDRSSKKGCLGAALLFLFCLIILGCIAMLL